MGITLYQYPACSTCRKAVKRLEGAGLAFESVHLKESPPSASTLRDLWQRSGLPLRKLFNTSGQSYRGGNWKARLEAATTDDLWGVGGWRQPLKAVPKSYPQTVSQTHPKTAPRNAPQIIPIAP